jgi:hypothetical protein
LKVKRATSIDQVAPPTSIVDEEKQSLDCWELPPFSGSSLESVQRGFREVPPLSFRQPWLPKEESYFSPGFVRIGWRAASLLVFAELSDEAAFSRTTGLNQRTWLLCDTLEIFLRPVTQQSYVEFHVTPNNHRLQLRFADADAAQRSKAPDFPKGAFIHEDAFRSKTWISSGTDRWFAYLEFPGESVGEHAATLNHCKWQFSFARYDYQPGRPEPVLSSTSPHAEPDFHRQQEWGVLHFQPSNGEHLR